MSTVLAKIEVGFDRDDICEFVNNSELTDEQVQEIADVLIMNLEDVMSEAGSVVSIDRCNFNDSYGDMQEDLQEMYGTVSDEEFDD